MTSRIPAAQYRDMAKPKRSKYGAKRVEVDGRKYDSKAEARYCEALLVREKAGEVCDVELQRPYPLLTDNGQLVGVYRADAAFFDMTEGRMRIIDVKGFDTPLSRWKRKHVRAQYGIEVEIVK